MSEYLNPNASTYYGLETNIENTGSDTINSALIKVGGKFVPTRSAEVNTLQFLNWSHGGAFQSCTVELQSDSSGSPSGSVLASGTVTPGANFTWNSVTLGVPYTVTAGTTYWIVIYGGTHTGINSLEIRRVEDTPTLLITAGIIGNKVSTDAGVSWGAQNGNYGVCIGVGYTTGSPAFEGWAYGDTDTTTFNGSTERWGERINLSSNLTFDQVEFWLKKNAAGTPDADCTYYIYNKDTATHLTTTSPYPTIVTAAGVTTSFVKYTATLASPITLTAGVNYEIGVNGVATGVAYVMLRLKTTGTGNGDALSFGASTNILVQAPGGSTDTTRDMGFRLRVSTASVVKQLAALGVG